MSSPVEPSKSDESQGSARSPSAPSRLNLPSRLSDQVPGLAAYGLQGTGAAGTTASGALKISDRDRTETRKVRTMLVSTGLFVVMVVGLVILAGSHSQPSGQERLEWNRAEIAVIQRMLIRTTRAEYEKALREAGDDPAKAIQAIVMERLQQEDRRTAQLLESSACQSDGDLWKKKRAEKFILERAMAWADGYDRPFRAQAVGLRLSVTSWGANGRLDTVADLPKDDLSANVTLPTGEPMAVKKWEELFTLPDMSQVVLFSPGDPACMAKMRARDPDGLTDRERAMERRYEVLNLLDKGKSADEMAQKLREYDLRNNLLPEGVKSVPPPAAPQPQH